MYMYVLVCSLPFVYVCVWLCVYVFVYVYQFACLFLYTVEASNIASHPVD